MLMELSGIEPAFALGEHTREMHSIVNWVVNGNLAMLSDPSMQGLRTQIVKALFFMAKYPFRPHSPHNVVIAGRSQVLWELYKSLGPLCRAEPNLFSFNPALLPEITNEEELEKSRKECSVQRIN
ncbi:hypothetical protein GZ77_10500 [Endozoicomonas montiporae]|uniref:Uncharacterized protein n=2 Tax=Endozoicomonas montiporae TaxID=1027273 RepID=A0A081N8F4_9GAMM|nr:hypothetical protein [Endozoicomonas montiporae]AMO55382.1 hypothetical protein EZMO1_1187 [Endozoicomonas montiporae CL-33]KEQ14727.1 hypothetical protein GZ77_10500 [Endozoicomonas montiporae]